MTLHYKPFYWIYRVASAIWYWAGRRFTLAGMCVAGGFVVTAAVGTDVENTVAYQAFALLLSLLLLAGAGAFFFRATFSVSRQLPRLGTAGQTLSYRVRVNNRTRQVQTGLTLLDGLADPRPPFREWLAFQLAENRRVRPFRINQRRRQNPFRRAVVTAAAVPRLPAGGAAEVVVELLPLRRGLLRFTGVTLARPDPLGLFRSFVTVPSTQTLLILPRRYPLPPIALPGTMKHQAGGVAQAANVGRSEEFVALRDYRRGDPLRHIHWRSWAKTGKPIVKEFEDEFFVRHALVLDTFTAEPHSELMEEAVSVAASFACTILSQESLLDLLFVGTESYCFTAGRGLAHADQMLEILAAVQNCPDEGFDRLEQLVLNHVSVVSGCICVLQKWDGPRQRFVEKLGVLGVPVLVLVVSPAGAKAPEPGRLRKDLVRFEVLEVGRIAEALAKLR